jgi:Trehalose utilisation
MKILLLITTLVLTTARASVAAPARSPVLIVADEIPAMQTLGKELETRIKTPSEITGQDKLPDSLAAYPAVIVYIHKDLSEKAENVLLDYAEHGGKLIVLHHSISSGKRKNKRWLPALGVELPTGDFAAGGYKYFDDVEWDILDLAPRSPITGKGVKFPIQADHGDGKKVPAYHPRATEIYLNHVLRGPHTILLGLRYQHKDSGKLYVQDTVAWQKDFGKGRIYYFMPGHHAEDFENPTYAQILANAVAAR